MCQHGGGGGARGDAAGEVLQPCGGEPRRHGGGRAAGRLEEGGAGAHGQGREGQVGGEGGQS